MKRTQRVSGRLPALLAALVAVLAPAAARAQPAAVDYLELPPESSFVLVVDRSGSMSGAAMSGAKLGVFSFMDAVMPTDKVALVSFSSDVRLDTGLTRDGARVKAAAYGLNPDGGTRLYDSIAKAAQVLAGEKGLRAIVYLTDGDDNGSAIRPAEIAQMNLGERVVVYGIGLGSVNHAALRDISTATGGTYRAVTDPAQLRQVYAEIVSAYYGQAKSSGSRASALVVTSVPGGRTVRIDGAAVGTTPFALVLGPVGERLVEVEFERGTWSRKVDVRAGFEARVKAKESEVPGKLIVESAPTGAAVFVDGSYVGLTSLVPSARAGRSADLSGQLTLEGVQPGRHRMRLIAVPDANFSAAQVMEFEFIMEQEGLYLKAEIFFGKAVDQKGRSYGSGPTLSPELRVFKP